MLSACVGRDTVVLSLLFFCTSAFAQEAPILRMVVPSSLESSGGRLIKPPAGGFEAIELHQSEEALSELPLSQIQKLSSERSVEIVGSNRSARDAELYRIIAPSVVRILTEQVNRSSISDSRMSSGYRSPLILTLWLQR